MQEPDSTGQDYNGVNFQTLRLTRVDPTIDFDWASVSPAPNVNADNFTVRWTGQVSAPVTGNYVFSTVSSGGVRVWVNGQQILNNWANNALTTNNSASIALVSGVRYAIVVEYRERANAASMRLRWSVPRTVDDHHSAVSTVPVIVACQAAGLNPRPEAVAAHARQKSSVGVVSRDVEAAAGLRGSASSTRLGKLR